MFPVVIDLGTWDLPLFGEIPVFLPTYGLLFATAVLIGWAWFGRRARGLGIPDDQVFNTPALLRPANVHLDDANEWADKVHQLFRHRTLGDSNLSGPLPVFWNFLLIDLPLPEKKG